MPEKLKIIYILFYVWFAFVSFVLIDRLFFLQYP